MTNQLDHTDFLPHIGTQYTITGELDQPVFLELIEVKPLDLTPESPREAFSLLFRAPESTLIPQHTYALSHNVMGGLDIFLVPIGPGRGGVLYEAIFA